MISKIFICIQILFLLYIYNYYIQNHIINDSHYIFEDIFRITIGFFIFTVSGFMTKYDIDKKLEWKIFIVFGIGLIPIILLSI